ncbi:hypothetical protein [Agromyces aureus]|uniref:Uncharacterized protein n=1 Tax=Agromyces aureus TaxID=453304 RepID=A0A191WH79_9MICO|nr:hypothetical protein [Agromyces aureus]ANJ27616.1 hypothetical protein ATC03_13770 [Agromyces aureus]
MTTGSARVRSGIGEHSFLRPARSARAASNIRSSHGGRRLAIGATIAAGLIILGHLVRAVAMVPYFPPGLGPWPGWIALLGIVAIGCVGWQVFRGMPDWFYVLLLVGLAVPVWFDLQATSGLAAIGVTPTAAPAIGAVLMPVSTIRSRSLPIIIACGVAFALVFDAIVQFGAAGSAVVPLFVLAGGTVLPVALTVAMLQGFSRLVRHEADLSLVQSTVGTARSAVGMRASEELAKLDFDAENLLEDVAAGRIGLPLSDDDAARAGGLAAGLRIRLIEGRNDTWLKHAVTESQYLSGRVQVDDPTGLAGPLSAGQREGLLLALWLLVADPAKPSAVPASVKVICREPVEPVLDDDDAEADVLHVATSVDLAIDVEGVIHRRVDPATWDAVANVGVHQMISHATGFRIEIICRIEPEALAPGQRHPAGRPIEEKSHG